MSTITASVYSPVFLQNEKRTAGKMTSKYDDRELIRLLCGDNAMQKQAIMFMMSKMQTNILKSLYSQGCRDEKREGFFLEGLTECIHKVRSGQFREDGNLEAYLKKICINIWFTYLRKEKATKAREKKVGNSFAISDLTADDLVFYEQRAVLLKEFLQDVGPGCYEIMSLKAQGYSSKEIAEMTIYSSDNGVNKRRSKCMERVHTLMKENPQVMKLLKELYEK